MAYAQQQQQQRASMQQHQFGFHPQPQHQPFAPHNYMPPLPSMQQFPYHHLQQQQQQQHQQHQQTQFHSHPPHHPHMLHQHPPPPFASRLASPLIPSPFSPAYDSSPAPVPPPPDPDLQKRIDKLVEYATKNGPEFEFMIREKQHDNPAYSFLFGGEGYSYYRYKLWLSSRPYMFNSPFQSPSAPMLHPTPTHLMSPAVPPMLGPPQIHQPHISPFHDSQVLHPPPFGAARSQPDFDLLSKSFRTTCGPVPGDVVTELNEMLIALNGTKESIKGAKNWFMQRSQFAPPLAEVLRDRVFFLDDSERQLHIIYVANDILFDSLQRRINTLDLDNEALAFKPVLGSMLARAYHNPQIKEENRSQLQKILEFWASKGVYDQETIYALEAEMVTGPPPPPPAGICTALTDSVAAGFSRLANHNVLLPHWQPDRKITATDQELPDKQLPNTLLPPGNMQLPAPVPVSCVIQPEALALPRPSLLLQAPAASVIADKIPSYPLFPPGLIPGMVRKMQIGSGVPYSPMSPLDIPTVIPPSEVSPSEILDRVAKFFKDIGEVSPSSPEGPARLDPREDEYEREPPARKGGACIPPPPNLQADAEMGGSAPDGSLDQKPGSAGLGRLLLAPTPADSNEVCQYDDVYISYRKQQSSTYHSSMSVKAATR